MAEPDGGIDCGVISSLFAEFCRLTDAMQSALNENHFEAFLTLGDERNVVEQALRSQGGTRWLDSLPELRPAVERVLQLNQSMMIQVDALKQDTREELASSHRQQRVMKLYRP
nr:hypothetical protein [uncultured Pseudogulbenkiania sp.]